jgi:hypothetical protein
MDLTLLLATVTLYSLSVADVAGIPSRQNDVKIRGDRVVIKDKSKPVRRELEDVYARLAVAIESNDPDAIIAFRHPEFSTVDLQGERRSADYMAERTRAMVSLIRPPIQTGNVLGTIEVQGDKATATVRQSFSRMQMVEGKLRKVDTSVTQDETWVRTDGGWKLFFVENVRDPAWYVDGKRIDPAKPYDPDAAPYEP